MNFILYSIIILTLSACLPISSPDEVKDEPGNQFVPAQNDADTGRDLPGNIEDPFSLVEAEVDGVLTEIDDGDAYGISFASGDIIVVKVTPEKLLDVEIEVHFFSSASLYEDLAVNDAGAGSQESITVATDKSHKLTTVSILLGSREGAGKYNLKVEVGSQNDAGSNADAPGDPENPLQINAGAFSGNFLGSGDLHDDFGIQLNAGQTLSVLASPSENLNLDFEIGYNCPQMCALRQTTTNNAFKGEDESFQFTAIQTGIHKFSIGKVGDTLGTYNLTVTIN